MKYICLFAMLFAYASAEDTGDSGNSCVQQKFQEIAALYSEQFKECLRENTHFADINNAIDELTATFKNINKDVQNCNKPHCYREVFPKYYPEVKKELMALGSGIAHHLGHMDNMDRNTVKCVLNTNSEMLNKFYEIPKCYV